MTEPTEEQEQEQEQEQEKEAESPKVEVMQADKFSEYMVYSKTEIVFLLRPLVEYGALFTVYFNEGKDFLLTSLLDVSEDGKYMVIDYGSDREMNQRALESKKLFFSTIHKSVKIQFILHGVKKILFENRDAFQAEIPDTLLRLQRRDFYRLELPVTKPLKFKMPIKKADGVVQAVEVHALDISLGGMAVVVPPLVRFERGMDFPDCSIELPGTGAFAATIHVCSVYEVTMRNGARVKHSGCQFVKLPVQFQNLIQRYIIRVERERRAHELGMD